MNQAQLPMSDLQNAIDFKRLELATATTPLARHNAWNELQALVKSRPKTEVQRLEKQMGLTR
jgi:hypothetical protein